MDIKPPSPTIEDYLGIIYTLLRDGDEIYGARLAELLNVSAPTVTITLRRMVRDGWITITPAKKIQLTAQGIQAAKAVIRRHMLTEWMLAKILNIPWSEIHEEADKLEHSISDDVEKSLSNTLQDPRLCPHGNPMPGSEGVSDDWQPLSQCQMHEKAIIRRIHELLEDNHNLLRFLEDNHIMPGTTVEVTGIHPSNKSLNLLVQSKSVRLDAEIANNIFVESI